MGTLTVKETAGPVNASAIRWGAIDTRLFEDLDVDVGALSRLDLEAYALELKAECRFLRLAWRSACDQASAAGAEGFRRAVAPYRAGLVATWAVGS